MSMLTDTIMDLTDKGYEVYFYGIGGSLLVTLRTDSGWKGRTEINYHGVERLRTDNDDTLIVNALRSLEDNYKFAMKHRLPYMTVDDFMDILKGETDDNG